MHGKTVAYRTCVRYSSVMDSFPPRDSVDGRSILERMDAAHVEICRLERARLRAVLECDHHGLWKGSGARDLAEFLATRYGISRWKARRWIAASYALEHLPLTAHALESGTLNLDKVIELTRFATAATEKKLITWARRVTTSAIRERADVETRLSPAQASESDSDRSLNWWWHRDGAGLEISGRLPVPEGATFIHAIDRLAKDLPDMPAPGETEKIDDYTIDQRRADALSLLASVQIAKDADPDRAAIVIHAPYDTITGGTGNGWTTAGSVVHPLTAQRLACDARLEVALHETDGGVVGVGRASREAPPWLRRQLLARDGNRCTFPGCEMRRFLRLHHMHWWEFGGKTNVDNLITVCHTHHKLVHEHRWSVALRGATAVWFRPGGREFHPGPSPPEGSTTSGVNEPRDETPWGALFHAIQTEDWRDRTLQRLLALTGPGMEVARSG